MGWLCYNATHYNWSTWKVDRKAEMDSLYNWEDETKTVSVLKSAMRGSTYYAAVQVIDKQTGERTVTAAVDLTCGSRDNPGCNFGYKPMGETMGPYQYDCPKSILDLLTPTDNEHAIEWRRRCEEHRKTKTALEKAEEVEFKFPFDITWSSGYEIKANEPVVLAHCKLGSWEKQRRWWIPGTNMQIRPSTIRNGTVIRIVK